MARRKAGVLYAAIVGGAIYVIAGRGRVKLFREQVVADVKAHRFNGWSVFKAIRNARRGVVPGETIVENLPAPPST